MVGPPDTNRDPMADHCAVEQPLEIADTLDGPTVELDEQVAGPDSGRRGRALVQQLHDLEAARSADVRRNARRQWPRAADDAEVRAPNAAVAHQGHEDAAGFNPEQHVLPNATQANSAAELVAVIRQQFKEGADFIKIYETGRDRLRDGIFTTPFQFSEAELTSAVREAARTGRHIAVHATGEPGTLYAARAGVVSIDHADLLSTETMRLMREKGIFAVPTFAISEYFAEHADNPERGESRRKMLEFHAREFRKQLAAGVPVIATKSEGAGEIIESERTGLLVEIGDIEAMAGAIGELLSDPTRREGLAPGNQHGLVCRRRLLLARFWRG